MLYNHLGRAEDGEAGVFSLPFSLSLCFSFIWLFFPKEREVLLVWISYVCFTPGRVCSWSLCFLMSCGAVSCRAISSLLSFSLHNLLLLFSCLKLDGCACTSVCRCPVPFSCQHSGIYTRASAHIGGTQRGMSWHWFILSLFVSLHSCFISIVFPLFLPFRVSCLSSLLFIFLLDTVLHFEWSFFFSSINFLSVVLVLFCHEWTCDCELEAMRGILKDLRLCTVRFCTNALISVCPDSL